MSQIFSETKVVLRTSGKEVKVRLSTKNEPKLYLVDENGERSETDSGIQEKEPETFMTEYVESGKILVSFSFCSGNQSYWLKVDGQLLKVRRSFDSLPNLKFEREGSPESYTLRTVGRNPQYLYVTKNKPFVLKLDPSEKRSDFTHVVEIPSCREE